jgi:hypothetical protein
METMVSGDDFVFPAAHAVERGLPGIGFRLKPPAGLAMSELEADALAVARAEERGPEGQLLGWIEIGVFSASLIIDRSGPLHDVAHAAAQAALVGPTRGRLLREGDVELAGGLTGYRVDLLLQFDAEGRLRPECPYASWLALAGDDVIAGGGLSVLVRSAGPTWQAGRAVLETLEIPGAEGSAPRIGLPLVDLD